MQHEYAWPFIAPVDSVEAPDYNEVVTNPMDFGTIQKRVDEGYYEEDPDLFAHDVRLIFENCLQYNEQNSQYSIMARGLSNVFEHRYQVFAEQVLHLAPTRSVSPVEYSRPKSSRSRAATMWTENEDSRLKKLIDKYGEDWSRISKYFPHKSPESC